MISVNAAYKTCIYALKSLLDNSINNCQYKSQIRFIIDQLEIMEMNKVKYSHGILLTAFIIHSGSAAAYDILRDYLVLPHPRTLQSLSSNLNISPDSKDCTNDVNYLQYISMDLEEREKLVLLLIDEIYIKSGIQYKGSKITGLATKNDDLHMARTVQSYMIKSAFGRFEEIVRLVPVLDCTGDEFYLMTMEVIHMLRNIGFIVFGIVTDDHTVNENLYVQILNQFPSNSERLCVEFPFRAPFKTFLMHDSVHLFKNIRNNWIKKRI